jgi:multiple sugar transport system permease protein
MKKKSKLRNHKYLAFAFHSPTFLILSIITLGPLLYAVYISFFDFRLSRPGGGKDFIGLSNYLEVFQSPEAFQSIFTTFKFMLIAVSCQVILGMILALAINSLPRFTRLITSLVLIPMMVAPLVVGLQYSFFLNPQFGFYSWLVSTLHLPLPASPLSTPLSALVTVALTDVWEWTPFLALMFLAGLQSIPSESFEAAKVDGATGRQIFRHVTLPLMMPVIVVGIILRSMEAFKEFDKPYILTGGGPGSSTEVIDMFTYRQAFISYNFSYAAAICVILFAILLFCGIMYGKFVLERDSYE